MGELSSHEYEKARQILWRYYDGVMDQVVEDIIRRAEDFESGSFGSADNIIDSYHCRIARIAGVYAHVRNRGLTEKPKGTQPLGRDEFRCFGCGHVIKREDDSCTLCGWTWK